MLPRRLPAISSSSRCGSEYSPEEYPDSSSGFAKARRRRTARGFGRHRVLFSRTTLATASSLLPRTSCKHDATDMETCYKVMRITGAIVY
jgi:hypothetical protein